MTKFENLMRLSDNYKNKAIKASDTDLKKFFYQAAVGFKRKAEKLTVEEASTVIF